MLRHPKAHRLRRRPGSWRGAGPRDCVSYGVPTAQEASLTEGSVGRLLSAGEWEHLREIVTHKLQRGPKKPHRSPGGALISSPRVWLQFSDVFLSRRQRTGLRVVCCNPIQHMEKLRPDN